MNLENGQILYHGSYTEVPVVDLKKCKDGLDFGKGFYVTSDYTQAMNYVPSAIRKAMRMGKIEKSFPTEEGVVSVYRYHAKPELLIHYFTEANLDWLHFVAANRDKALFPTLLQKYSTTDIICGKIADDRTARTLQAYLAGLYGEPGEPQTDKTVIEILLPNRLSEQVCFRTVEAVGALEFIRSVKYGDRNAADYR